MNNMKEDYFRIQLEKYFKSYPQQKSTSLFYSILTNEKERLKFAITVCPLVYEQASLLNINMRTLQRLKNKYNL